MGTHAQKKDVKQIPLKDGRILQVEVSYDKGGMTLGAMMGFSSGPENRGYSLIVRREDHRNGYQSFILGDGVKKFLKPAKRFSAKELAAIEVTDEQIAPLLARYKDEIAT